MSSVNDSGLKTKDDTKDGCQNKISLKILIVLPYMYLYGIHTHAFELLLD